MSRFSKNIRYLRKKRKLSQEQLAGELGLNRGNIASYEKGTAEPSMKNLSKFSGYFKVNLNDLVEKDLEATEPGRVNDRQVSYLSLTEDMTEEQLVDTLIDNKERLETFRKRSDEMARILEGFRQFHKFKMESMPEVTEDVRKMAHDYEKLMEVLEAVLRTNKNLLQIYESIGEDKV